MKYQVCTLLPQTAVRGKQRIKRLDNDINAQLMESLFNVEPMLLLGGQSRETAAFDRLLKGFQDAAVRFEYVTGFLTAVQVGLNLDNVFFGRRKWTLQDADV